MRPRQRRVCAVVLLILLSSLAALRSAHAELTRRALALGRSALDLDETWLASAPRELWINGAHVRIATGHADLALAPLLDRLEAGCRSRSKLLGGELRHLLGVNPPAIIDGILRAESEREGVVACLDFGREPLGVRGLLHRLGRFARSLDLAELGSVRMVRAEARPQGAFFVATWSEGPLPLSQMFPREGDAPGFDLEIGRPPAARRLLSALQVGREPTMLVYESARALAPAFESYVARARRVGFVALSELSQASERSALLQRAGRTLLLWAGARARGTIVAVVPLDHFARNRSAPADDTGSAMRKAP